MTRRLLSILMVFLASVMAVAESSEAPEPELRLAGGTVHPMRRKSMPPAWYREVPYNTWFLIAATDGSATDGSGGQTLACAERTYAGASTACPGITQHVTTNACP